MKIYTTNYPQTFGRARRHVDYKWPTPPSLPPPFHNHSPFITPSRFRQLIPSSISYSIPTQKAGNALMTLPGLRVYMGGDNHVLSGGSHAHLPLKNAIRT
ncbi:hypothetical protein EVAR_87045_1 [Eumeta japonica]|uniref:Uncharacterized protein n=1 Tax=Eumeta variegata TaxID=151549 RepID=A0A4C1SLM8_EUMVA|nr:hypothetical protein EVAR_87045_1 [Eumeta japonica]